MKPNTWAMFVGLLVLGLGPRDLSAQGEPGAFLSLMRGARPMGMGGAFTALADDVNAVFFNPAGISAIPHKEVTFTHLAELGFDRKANFFAATIPSHAGDSAWGFSYSRFTIDGIPETRVNAAGAPITDAAGNVIVFSLFDDIEEAATVSYGWKQTDKIRLGATARLIHQDFSTSQADNSGTGLGMDFGALFQPTPDVRIGLALKDMFEAIDFSTTSAEVPFKLALGAAIRGYKHIVYAIEVERVEGQGTNLRLGAEKWWQKHYAARVGLADGKFSAGVSAKFNAFQFDYAFKQQDLSDENRLSLTYRF